MKWIEWFYVLIEIFKDGELYCVEDLVEWFGVFLCMMYCDMDMFVVSGILVEGECGRGYFVWVVIILFLLNLMEEELDVFLVILVVVGQFLDEVLCMVVVFLVEKIDVVLFEDYCVVFKVMNFVVYLFVEFVYVFQYFINLCGVIRVK